MPHLYHRKKRGRRAQWGRQSNNSKLCSGRTTLLLRDMLTYREEWNKCLPANLSLLKKSLDWFIWRLVRFTTTQEHVILAVRIIRFHLALHRPTKLLCSLTYTMSCLIFGMYILDQGYSGGNRFTVQFPFQTTSATCVSSLEDRIFETLVNISIHVPERMTTVIKDRLH